MFSASIIIRAIRLFTSFLFGSTGEIITEKSGHLNLGTPGIMCIGGIGGCLGLSSYITWCGGVNNTNGFLAVLIAIIFTCVFSGIAGLLYSFLTVTLRANQNITGLTITTFGVGFANFLSHKFDKNYLPKVAKYFNNLFNLPADAPEGLQVFFSYGILVYLAIILAILVTLFFKKTRIGLHLRAVGESPQTADAQGISISRYRYLATIIGAAISGLGGLSFVMDFSTGMFDQAASIENLGWLAVALVIFSVWKPTVSIGGSFLFAYLYVLPSFISAATNNKELIKMAPYIATILVLILTSIFGERRVQPPQALGINYFREDR